MFYYYYTGGQWLLCSFSRAGCERAHPQRRTVYTGHEWVNAGQKNQTTKGTYSTAHYQIDKISGSGPVPVKEKCVVISPCFAIFKNVVHR